MGCRSNGLCVYYVVRYFVASIEGVHLFKCSIALNSPNDEKGMKTQ